MKRINYGTFCALLLTVALLIPACGGGGSAPPPQQKGATISFGIFQNSTTHIGAVEISARLPAGVEVALVPGTVQLQAPQLSSTKGLVLGSYSASSRKVNLSFQGNTLNIGNGTFATLNCTIQPGNSFTQESFTSINNPFPHFKAIGIDLSTLTQITTDDVLMGKVTPTMSVSFTQ